ncbi:hypothetical protein [Aquicella lusitana]|nr:hypothetical protein [Aquicella lusitana]
MQRNNASCHAFTIKRMPATGGNPMLAIVQYMDKINPIPVVILLQGAVK